MIQLTLEQLSTAVFYAEQVAKLQRARARARTTVGKVTIGGPTTADPLGTDGPMVMEMPVSAEAINEHLDMMLRSCQLHLTALGIELVEAKPAPFSLATAGGVALPTIPQN